MGHITVASLVEFAHKLRFVIVDLYLLPKTSFVTFINMYVFCIDGQNETNTHLERPFYLYTLTWKYGGSVFGTAVAG